MVQGELFREDDHLSGSSLLRKKSFLSRHEFTISLEKLLLGFIGLSLVFVLTYSFGVERGKRAMEKQIQTLVPVQTETISTSVQSIPETASTELSAQPIQKETVLLVDKTVLAKDQIPMKTEPAPATELATTTAPPAEEKKKSGLPKVDQTKGKYTVQLITYQDEKLTDREIKHLQSKGHEGFVIPSGNYFQVCVNYFESRAKAINFLKQFSENSRYPGAYIRPVLR